MTKIDIFSGFLGAGKTTLIKKLISEAYAGEKLVLIENEFGEIGIDGGFLQDAGINITEMNSGCICCSLVGDFGKALQKVLTEYAPDRILIEPSGVGKLSDVVRAVENIHAENAILNAAVTVCDAAKCKMYMKNFGEFFNDQVEHAGTIVLSHTGKLSAEKIEAAVALLREHNENAAIVSTDWDKLDGKQILDAMEKTDSLEATLKELHAHHHHHHEDECDDPECECHHHHHHDEDEHEHCEHHHHHHEDECDDPECECHHHHHHDEDEHEHCEHHHHHHEDECDDPECECHHHHHHDEDDHEHCEHHHHHEGECDDPECECHHHHHHHADDVFTSMGAETTKRFTREEILHALEELAEHADKYGTVLRAKGIVECVCGKWIHFDYVPGEPDVRVGSAAVIGRLCVIGAGIHKDEIAELFGVPFKK